MGLLKERLKIRKSEESLDELVRKTALRTLSIEREALEALEASIDDVFISTVELLYQCKGRVVVTGIGKSAIVGQKVVATFNSTGTPALFMHAADAIHGDLGMIQSDDIVICLSKSGETAEIKALIPMLRQMRAAVVAIVGNPESYLARKADRVLLTPVSQEADPNNLAPTASTTAQMALGDALATSLLALRGFSPEDFALFHPGGALGKQLYLQVADLMVHNEKPAVSLADPISRVILEMTSKRLGATAVLDSGGKLVGVITDGDLRRMLEKGKPLEELIASDVMSQSPKTIQPEQMAVKALDLMRTHSITQLIVAEGNSYLGMIHLHDLIREGIF